MANPDEKTVSFEFEGKKYRLHWNNAAKRVAEKFADMSMSDMAVEMSKNPLGSPTVLTAILWGGTRRYASRKLLTPDAADALMDRLDDAETETVLDVSAALIACFYGMEKQEWLDILNGEMPDEEEEDEDPDEEDPDEEREDEADGSPGEAGEDGDPKDQKSGSETPTEPPSDPGSDS